MEVIQHATLKLAAAISLSLVTSVSIATEYTKQTTLTHFGRQATRPIQPSTENREFINFPSGATWSVAGGSGGAPCIEGGAVLPENDPTLRAIALAAVTSGAMVIVNVDNSLPTVAGQCQITALYLVAQ